MIKKISDKVLKTQGQFLKELRILRRKTKNPLIIAMVGLVGSGKSTISKALSSKIGATIIEGNRVHTLLRKNRQNPIENKERIIRNAIQKAIAAKSNVILDSDYGQSNKRKKLRQIARKNGAKLLFIRTYVDSQDILFGRIVSARYSKKDLFGSARNEFKGNVQLLGAIKKAGEIWRRTPHHYRWSSANGGKWIPKETRGYFAEIDTTNEKRWRKQLDKIANKIKSTF